MVTEAKSSAYYDTNVSKDLSVVATWNKLYNKAIDFLPSDVNVAVADLGCGPGYFAKILYKRGYKVYWGVDFAKVCIRMARENVPEFEYTFGNLYSKGIQKRFSEYDIFILLETLEHLSEDISVLSVIPKGRRIIFSVPNRGGEGHVRVLISQKQVAARYDGIVEFNDSLILPGSEYDLERRDNGRYVGKVFFLVHGKRR